jgi:hypothetical protein
MLVIEWLRLLRHGILSDVRLGGERDSHPSPARGAKQIRGPV